MWLAVLATTMCIASAGGAGFPTLPPGVAPIPRTTGDGATAMLSEALAQLVEPRYAPVPGDPPPVPGSATESEALRRYARAQMRRQHGQPVLAAQELDAALRLHPASAELHRARADVAAEAGHVPRAVLEWELVLALRPDDHLAALAVGVAALEAGQAERAAALLGPVWLQEARGAGTLTNSARFALGATLARALLCIGFDRAALPPAEYALAVDPRAIAAERTNGLDPAVRDVAALARDAGEAALRLQEWEWACSLLQRSVEYAPEPRAQGLAAVAAVRADQPRVARAVLLQLLQQGVPATEAQTLLAQWLLQALGGDAQIAGLMRLHLIYAPADGRAARLLAAADPSSAARVLDAAITNGTVDRATVRAAFEAMPVPAGVDLALRILRADPTLVRTVSRELVRRAQRMDDLHGALAAVPESPEREALRSAVASHQRCAGEGWILAEAAAKEWPDHPAAYFAMIEAATAAADPALVQRVTEEAPELLCGDADWHAVLARAAQAAGLDELAAASRARNESLDPAALVGGRASPMPGGGRAEHTELAARERAELALARGDLAAAMPLLMEAYAVDPDDETALGMLLRVLTRVAGAHVALQWLEEELARVPNEPVLWDGYALQAIVAGRVDAALGLVDARQFSSAGQMASLRAREVLLRAAGREEMALEVARERVAALPPGPRRSLQKALVEGQGGDPSAAVDALRDFAEGAFPPPPGMRIAALDVLRRMPVDAERSAVMRRIARDAILADAGAPLEFFAFEALGVASDPELSPMQRLEFVGMIAQEAAAVTSHRRRESIEGWRAAGELLLSQGYPAEAEVFMGAWGSVLRGTR